ncbi:MAG: ATP-binding protein [Candidatus Oceanisphaera merdipullorum]|nr:ATP-binding protein [Candidatus Oceanisphaera merdipullorum]
MIETLAFRTQARTIDHLGREQIADCPTAISELWKNSYDAYARSVALHIFDGPEPVAAIFDDGHGMSYDEFVNRWLVVGTQSKYQQSQNDTVDRDGLSIRTKQGQKGIGRLSSANLGPLLLLISKRREQDFVVALIDWRIFENPFLTLSDIEIPVTTASNPKKLLQVIPELFQRLMENIQGNNQDNLRAARLSAAWENYDLIALENDPVSQKPSESIINTIINAKFDDHHLEPWAVWSGEKDHGTALLVTEINYDLKAQLPSIEPNGEIQKIREGFKTTLSAFTDPYINEFAHENNAYDPEFLYEVKVWSQGIGKSVVTDNREVLSRQVTDEMEHVISGNIDEKGVFRGQIKAFGEWVELGEDCIIEPPKDYVPPKGPTTFVGPFALYVATYERERLNSTHSDSEHIRLFSIPKELTGFLIFRNGLRVLPYGRIDNDFFEIESRRSISAGREYWNARRMFGRIALSRESNPNLRDKAGREGFIDNRSAKALRNLVTHILRHIAYQYLGSASDLRKEVLPDIKAQNEKNRAENDRKELAKKNVKKFRGLLKKNLPALEMLYKNFEECAGSFTVDTEDEFEAAQELINNTNQELSRLRITGAPSKLGSNEDDYRRFRTIYVDLQSQLRVFSAMRTTALQRINPAKPEELAERQLRSHASRLQAKLRNWRKAITQIQESEVSRVDRLFEERNKEFHLLALPLIEEVKSKRLFLAQALDRMQEFHEILEAENENTFQSYLDTLEVLSENINIELIARQSSADNIALREDLNRLHQVAQLGVTVEILGHELNTNARMIQEGLKQIKKQGKVQGVELIESGFEALSQQLEFLSPLKISTARTRRNISGEEIVHYLNAFFDVVLRSRNIQIEANKDFYQFCLSEQPSRLLPVFVNLINNSIYWLVTSQTKNPKIKLSVVDEKVIVSDNGPGIDPVDQENLFKMFFTRKISGGRGIGLYLCRVNLLAAGHSIEYTTDSKFQILKGANFVIFFKGASFD